MRHIMLIALLTLAWGCSAPPADLDINTFAGLWEVDFDRTMEAAKQSPKYNEAEAERLPEMIKRMMGMMKIELTSSEMIYRRGTKEVAIPFGVSASDGTTVTVTAKQGEVEVTVVFTRLEEDGMSFKSSATDDMDYYVWRRVAE